MGIVCYRFEENFMKSKLVLLPNVLDETLSHEQFLPVSVAEKVQDLDVLIAESEKGGRKFLMRFEYPEGKTFRDIDIRLLNEHSDEEDVKELVQDLSKGGSWGLISDCGLPCIADPGAQLIAKLGKGVHVEVVPGPSSIIMALMLSGIQSQSFAFNGYLPRKPEHVKPEVIRLQMQSESLKQTQICIEAPYRSKKMLQSLISYLSPDTTLSIAWNITMPNQGVMTKTIAEWRSASLPDLNKAPTVFIFKAAFKKKQPFDPRKRGRFVDPRKRRGKPFGKKPKR